MMSVLSNDQIPTSNYFLSKKNNYEIDYKIFIIACGNFAFASM